MSNDEKSAQSTQFWATSGKFSAGARRRRSVCALGRAIKWTHLNNPLPEQPRLVLDTMPARKPLDWLSRRDARQTIGETAGWYSSERLAQQKPVSPFAIDEELAT